MQGKAGIDRSECVDGDGGGSGVVGAAGEGFIGGRRIAGRVMGVGVRVGGEGSPSRAYALPCRGEYLGLGSSS